MDQESNRKLPSHAQAVVIGGGVIGCSVAYHLALLGMKEVVLVEQGQLTCGSTWHAAGIVGLLRSQQSLTDLVRYSTELYGRLEKETGQATGWKNCGSLWVATSEARLTQLKRRGAVARGFGIEWEIISPTEALRRWPLMRIDDVVGAAWIPGDGKLNPSDVTMALASGARSRGVRIFEGVRVTGIDVEGGRVTGMGTDQGHITSELVINCAGQWAKMVGALAGVTVPLHSAEHFYLVTEPMEGVLPDLPMMRDPDAYTYFKEEVGGLLMGGFEPNAKPWLTPDALPNDFGFKLLEEDWDQFSILMENAIVRVPDLQHAGIKKLYNGPESFTPDTNWLLGEAPEVRNFFVACGFNSGGIASAGGAGKALAEWIVNRGPTLDLWAVDIRRFAKFNNNSTWLRDRVTEALGLHYAMPWPNRDPETARSLRRSPFHHTLQASRASFGTKMGWERPNWFAPPGVEPKTEYAWGKPNWFPYSAGEHIAARQNVAVFDQTSFSKFILKGRDVEEVLQKLCANDVAVSPGSVVYTAMLNDRAGFETDLTVTRLALDQYFIVTGSGQTTRDFDYIERRLPASCNAALVDVTSAFAVLGVMGPRSRELLSRVSRADISDRAFPFATSREIDIGYATARATRITYVGELGWELYIPTEFAAAVYETLMGAGDDLGITPAGYYAIDSLRIEKGYRAWGRDITPEHTPLEAGLMFACKFDKDVEFNGRRALLEQRVTGPARRLVSFVLDDPAPMMWGDELILRNGEPAGQITSAAFGHSLGAAVSMGYVTRHGASVDQEYLRGGEYAIDVAGVAVPATLHLKAPFDPASTKVRL